MVLKRKRSESELSSSSAFSSPSRLDHDATPFPFSFTAMGMALTSPHPASRASTPSHLPSRTMKRFRDSRPSAEEIHQRTLHMLFSAQARTQQNMAQPPTQQPQAAAAEPTQQHSGSAQVSLHKFWNLPSGGASPAGSAPPVNNSIYAPTDCEDCGQSLRETADGNTMDMDIDIDGFSAEADTGCGMCGKHVCSHCSITNLGEQRRCLICAGKKVWVGGFGWIGMDVEIC
ncbi:uncharacterized protein BCR38DRAFT_125410 [Pseudomassariella vexata]|uniref:Uncharacterized protein n=1 Tax=Pseudomassariella vexata TaxID=1141098 RepID=A0A1Y2D8C1_9PEZI|nr:uncharacterized protein BCR38DRAFT_125410 [Pseudomassariella vexata]ORY55509.1 hypothetical protein BCR38DRAFT_125410 [Pseudomassariella vexata]